MRASPVCFSAIAAKALTASTRGCSVLAELCLPLARVGGVWIAQKNAAPEQEVRNPRLRRESNARNACAALTVSRNAQVADARRAVAVLGGGVLSVDRVATLGPDGLPFTAITCRKERPCDALYPREAGTPKRQPL